MFKRVLVAYDGSPCSEAAVALGAKMARELDSHVTIFFALDLGELPFFEWLSRDMSSIRGDANQFANDLVQEARKKAGDSALIDTHVAQGHSWEAIVLAAIELHCDLIVIGSHGRRGLERTFFGSVAEGVTRASPIPVLVVKSKD
jgi:nucleotide-binding universal stress UspA family protein